MYEPHLVHVTDPDLRAAIHEVWAQMPPGLRIQLENVRFIQDDGIAPWGQADIVGDIYLRPLPRRYPRSAAVGVVAHELGHLAGKHHQRIAARLMTEGDAERDADKIARSWGFHVALLVRSAFLGR